MKAAFVKKYGGPEVLTFRDTPIPRPEAHQVLVRVRAIGLNFADIIARWGVYPGTPRPPFVPGMEFSGDVVAVGLEVKLFTGRERVMGFSRWGSHAEFVAVDEEFANELPPGFSYEEGASFLVSFLTAYHGLVRLGNVQPGERVLIHAAAGGAGMAAVQMALHLKAEIFATAGTDEKITFVRNLGAHHVVNYMKEDFKPWVLKRSGDRGVDVVMDSVGGKVFTKSWALLAPMGRYILFGLSSVAGDGGLSLFKVLRAVSAMSVILPHRLLTPNKGIFGFNLGTLQGQQIYLKKATEELHRLLRLGVIKPIVGAVFPFDRIVEAHRALQTRHSLGKVVVSVD